MVQPEAAQRMNFSALAASAPAWVPGILNAQHEFRAKLEEARDAVVEAIWEADAEGYIGVDEAIDDPEFTGTTRDAIAIYVNTMLDAGKFAEIDAMMERIDEAEENYDPDDEEDDDEDE